MNRAAILFHLKEAMEELDRTIAEIENDRKYGAGTFLVKMSHLYHHLNCAWHVRNVSAKRHWACSEEDFYEWRKFPTEAEMMLDRVGRGRDSRKQH
jgi:hypothetical protein